MNRFSPRTLLCVASSLVLLGAAMLTWPDLFVLRKYLMLPAWTHILPSPWAAGTYLSAAALLPVVWGVSGLARAAKATAMVVALAPLVLLAFFALRVPLDARFVPSLVFNYIFVGVVRLCVPALALLALRWSARTWWRL